MWKPTNLCESYFLHCLIKQYNDVVITQKTITTIPFNTYFLMWDYNYEPLEVIDHFISVFSKELKTLNYGSLIIRYIRFESGLSGTVKTSVRCCTEFNNDEFCNNLKLWHKPFGQDFPNTSIYAPTTNKIFKTFKQIKRG